MTLQPIDWIKKHSLAAYFLLAFLITWILISPLVLSSLHLLDSEISEHWHSLGALGPIGAALIVTAIAGGKAGVSEFLNRLTRWKVGAGWIFVSIFSPFIMFLLSVLIVQMLGTSPINFGKLASGEYATFAWLGGLLLPAVAYGIGEEAGWRGFACQDYKKNAAHSGRLSFLQYSGDCGMPPCSSTASSSVSEW